MHDIMNKASFSVIHDAKHACDVPHCVHTGPLGKSVDLGLQQLPCKAPGRQQRGQPDTPAADGAQAEQGTQLAASGITPLLGMQLCCSCILMHAGSYF